MTAGPPAAPSPPAAARSSAAALTPAAALAHAVALLTAHGFSVTARNERGDSLYLARPGQRMTLRISNHARRPRQRRNHPEVAVSLVIAAPRSVGQVEAAVAAALRDYGARVGRGDPAAA